LHEDRLGEIHLSRDRLHRILLKSISIGENRKRISFKTRVCENIQSVKTVTHGVAGRTGLQLLQFSERPFISDISGIQRALRLKK
jgi:hypothetical protein